MFVLGSFVKIQGLEKAAQYNGLVGLVVKDKSEDRYGVQVLDHALDWNEHSRSTENKELQVGGVVIAVKESNLKESSDSPYWQVADMGSVVELIRTVPSLAEEDSCDKLCEKIWNTFFETIPSMPLFMDPGEEQTFRDTVKHETGHKIFWLQMDAIQHHLIIEKCRGRYRVHQSYVQEDGRGYTAKEWCTVLSKPSVRLGPMHQTFGGGRTVGELEILGLLDRIYEFQQLNKHMIRSLLTHVEGTNPSFIPYFEKGPMEVPPHLIDSVQANLQLAVSWSNRHEDLVGPLGITWYVNDEPKELIPYDLVPVTQGSTTLFEIPKKYYVKAREINQHITGQTILNPVIFLRMINSGIWWKFRRDGDGGGVGYTVRCAALDTMVSEKQGRKAAKAKTQKVRDILSWAS